MLLSKHSGNNGLLCSTTCLLAALVSMPATAQNPSTRTQTDNLPNVLLIYTDDLGYGDLSSYGATKVQTPNIDRLAAEGRLFTDAHSASAVCSPARYGLLTGEYPLRKNFWGPIGITDDLVLDTDRITMGTLFSQAEYETAFFGKWHLGFQQGPTDWNAPLDPGPRALGFDYFFGIPRVNSGPPFVYVENEHIYGFDPKDPLLRGVSSITKRYPEKMGYDAMGGAEEAHRRYVDDQIGTELTERAVQWLQTRDQAYPFFLFFSTTHIHHPFTPAPRFIGTSEIGLYGDFIHELDWMVGELLAQLERMGAEDNTMVVFSSDNGGMLNVTAQEAVEAGHALNGPLLGYKFGAWEGGHRIPLLVRWPGHVPAGSQSDALFSQTDFMATFAAILGHELPAHEARDSYNQLPNLLGPGNEAIRKEMPLSPNSPRHLSVRHGDWIFIPEQGEGGFQGQEPGVHTFGGYPALVFSGRTHSDLSDDGTLREDAPPAQLYNLKDDPYQTINLYPLYPELVRSLEARVAFYRTLIPPQPRIGWIDLNQ